MAFDSHDRRPSEQDVARKQTEPPPTPGNSGAWYLELVGVELPPDVRTTNGGGNGSVGQLWDPTGGGDILDGWAPEALSRTVSGTRRFRWTVIGALVLTGLVAVLALLIVPTFVEEQANALNAEYRQALLGLNADLAPAQVVLERATDPVETLDDLGSASATLASMSESSNRIRELARDELPATLPLVPRDSLAALQPARDRMVDVGSQGTELARRITLVAEYTTRAEGLLAIPRLPVVANDRRITDLSVTLAGVQAETAAILATLPDDAALASHTAQARAAQARLGSWQTEYLESLRNGEEETARALINEMADLRSSLVAALVAAKASLRTELDGSLLRLAGQIEATLVLLPR
jgi:hypothetical protein